MLNIAIVAGASPEMGILNNNRALGLGIFIHTALFNGATNLIVEMETADGSNRLLTFHRFVRRQIERLATFMRRPVASFDINAVLVAFGLVAAFLEEIRRLCGQGET